MVRQVRVVRNCPADSSSPWELDRWVPVHPRTTRNEAWTGYTQHATHSTLHTARYTQQPNTINLVYRLVCMGYSDILQDVLQDYWKMHHLAVYTPTQLHARPHAHTQTHTHTFKSKEYILKCFYQPTCQLISMYVSVPTG